MFGPIKTTAQQRFNTRIEKHKKGKVSVWRHHFWWFVHNCIAHVGIGLFPCKKTFKFHDYTSDKINLND